VIIPSMDIPGTVLTLAYWTDQGFRPESRGALYKIEDTLRENPLTDTFGGLTPEEVQVVQEAMAAAKENGIRPPRIIAEGGWALPDVKSKRKKKQHCRVCQDEYVAVKSH